MPSRLLTCSLPGACVTAESEAKMITLVDILAETIKGTCQKNALCTALGIARADCVLSASRLIIVSFFPLSFLLFIECLLYFHSNECLLFCSVVSCWSIVSPLGLFIPYLFDCDVSALLFSASGLVVVHSLLELFVWTDGPGMRLFFIYYFYYYFYYYYYYYYYYFIIAFGFGFFSFLSRKPMNEEDAFYLSFCSLPVMLTC
jgi:hypothetical protein